MRNTCEDGVPMKRRNLLIATSAGTVAGLVASEADGAGEAGRGVLRAEQGPGWTIEQPQNSPASNAYLFFRINQDDVGDPKAKRVDMDEFINRRPLSVVWDVVNKSMRLVVSNGGATASDLIRVDYEVRYCTVPSHSRSDGFTSLHAGEQKGSTTGAMDTLDFVPAGSSEVVRVPLKDLSAEHVKIYVRARVVGMFTAATKSDTWNFATDPSVIEACKDLP